MISLMVLLAIHTAHAGFLPAYDLLALVQDADVIAVGRVEKIQPTQKIKLETGGFDANGQKVSIEVQRKQASIEKKLGIKNELILPATLVFPVAPTQATTQNILPPFVFPQIEEGVDSLLFLKQKDKGNYELVYPLNLYGTVIPLSSNTFSLKAKEIESLKSPLRKVLLLLADEIPTAKEERALRLLSYIQQVAPLLYIPIDYTPSLNYSFELAALRRSLGEGQPDLETWIQQTITPQILPLTKSPNPPIRHQAILTVAALQDVSVLPQVIEMAASEMPNGPQEAHTALRQYRTPEAIKGLIAATKHPNISVRREAVFALGSINETAIAPILLRLLDEPDEKVRQYALGGLNALFEVQQPKTEENREFTQAENIKFWKSWATQNASVVQKADDKLKNQFLK